MRSRSASLPAVRASTSRNRSASDGSRTTACSIASRLRSYAVSNSGERPGCLNEPPSSTKESTAPGCIRQYRAASFAPVHQPMSWQGLARSCVTMASRSSHCSTNVTGPPLAPVSRSRHSRTRRRRDSRSIRGSHGVRVCPNAFKITTAGSPWPTEAQRRCGARATVSRSSLCGSAATFDRAVSRFAAHWTRNAASWRSSADSSSWAPASASRSRR